MKRMPKVAGFRLVKESTETYNEKPPTRIRMPKDVFVLMEPFANRELAETFWVIPLNAQHDVIGGPIAVSRGILTEANVHAREIFRSLILLNACAVIFCHNHPGGDPTPSPNDRMVTDSLLAAGKILDIPVHDHIIIGNDTGRYVSFAESGLL